MKLILTLILTFSIAISLTAQDLPPAGRYKVIPEQSQIEIHAGTSGVFGFMGHGHTIAPKVFSGEMNLSRNEAAPATVTIRIDATSLKEMAEFKAEDKKTIETQLHGEVLETTKYSEITFQSSAVRYTTRPGHVVDAQIEGELALHGVTRKITVPATITVDGEILRANGKFKIDRRDYAIEPKSAGGGTVKVDKTLEISFRFALKQE